MTQRVKRRRIAKKRYRKSSFSGNALFFAVFVHYGKVKACCVQAVQHICGSL